jgi:uncharacterized membrane protein
LPIALVASLALNLFLTGIVGVWAVRPLFHEPPPPSVGGMMDRMSRRVPEADRPILRQAFAKRQDEIGRLFQEIRQSQQAVRASLRAEPFDPAAYDAATERARQARAAIESVMQSATREAVMAMSHEGRERFAQRGRGRGRD